MAIEFDLHDGIATITINRPERRNALDSEHYAALSQAWIRVRDDADVRVAVITGAGDKAFCAGADIKSFVGRAQPLSEVWLTQKDSLLNRGLEIWKPVIAAVNGACVGGGMTLLMATDIRVACEEATFSISEVKRGIIAANGGTQRVMKQLPYAIAMEMLLLGDTMDAATAERWGLVNRVVPRDKMLDTAHDLANRIKKNAPLAVQAAKELAVRALDMSLSEGLRMEQFVNRILHHSEDTKRAKEAFAEKRVPEFRGE
ncbi:enoyl-CoA hydratase/isomerase family protein [Phyllobacterium sp. YR531]|uniref:enoyl-CoA hydratase/isomerase family protein n=1 Tax=Phyllobacterium sp. YR531 TaxID=1144343 RepID=UPI00026FB1DB|nr:enoyl-CoA hydratase/isomerase family protein [Phyllobacterium sp. YR531]EJN06744.1 enoyl-CoA hydratase/carnithine racemase [Phyllobacterium sp. YR531]